ncbi:MAG: preprotein translocase subunit YajC [Burkholderiales bacterium]|nr:preprotein translocase subunit YajC [Burkholderiales bacterium]
MFISPAHAQAPAGGGGGGDPMSLTIMMVLMFVVLWFVMVRPQMKRAKEHKVMVEALQKGDEVVAAGGMVGRITKITDAYITIEIADNIEIVVQRGAVQTVLPKGTIKSL